MKLCKLAKFFSTITRSGVGMESLTRNKLASIFLAFLFLLNGLVFQATNSYAAQNHDELFVYIGDSIMKAKKEDWDSIYQNMKQFEDSFQTVKNKESKVALQVEDQLKAVYSALETKNKEQISEALSALSTSLVNYDAEQNPIDIKKERQKLKVLLPIMEDLKSTVEAEDYGTTNRHYQNLQVQWTAVEKIVRAESVATYGEIETKMAFLRIAITQEPQDQEKALNSLAELTTAINNFMTGKETKNASNESYALSDVVDLISVSIEAIQSNDIEKATTELNQSLIIWPMVEGEVSTRDSKLYSDMETKIPIVISLLSSINKDTDKATEILLDLKTRLQPLLTSTSYSYWDAALILLREGLEALLIVVTLIAFLRKTNHADKQKWIWGGVAVGVGASALFAILITFLFSKLTAASGREYIEGIVGIIAVVMMITVGMWLHNNTNIKKWNNYIQKYMGKAIATGSLVTFSAISFLAIFREGAETIIFYVGMAPNMELSQLSLGIAIAFVILLVIGFLMIRYSVNIPIRPFFIVATVLIYFLAFKILGMSIHSLQVAGVVPTHSLHDFPHIDWIGLFPSLETFIPQLVLFVIICATSLWLKRNEARV